MDNTQILKVSENIKKVILGKDEVIEKILIAILAKGHILIEDMPGVGKTTLAKTLAKSMDLSYKRIQFTPDLMPSDIIGVNIYNKNTGDFNFKKGPIFHQVFLADEINRTSPKTQSSLLQAMEEREVSTEDMDYILAEPFIVLATQNPLEYQGTFPLPEAQLDRFLMRISIGYPDPKYEWQILENHSSNSLDYIKPSISQKEILDMQAMVEQQVVHEDIIKYIVDISNGTRDCKDLQLGASPRASIDLLKASKAKAFMENRNYVIPDDVKEMAIPVLSHRLIPSPEARIEGKNIENILENIIKNIYIPVISNEK